MLFIHKGLNIKYVYDGSNMTLKGHYIHRFDSPGFSKIYKYIYVVDM